MMNLKIILVTWINEVADEGLKDGCKFDTFEFASNHIHHSFDLVNISLKNKKHTHTYIKIIQCHLATKGHSSS